MMPSTWNWKYIRLMDGNSKSASQKYRLLVINKICQILWKLLDFMKSTNKRPEFSRLHEAIWLKLQLTKSLNSHLPVDPFGQENYCMNSPQAIGITQLKNDTIGLVSRLLEKDFVNYRKPYG